MRGSISLLSHSPADFFSQEAASDPLEIITPDRPRGFVGQEIASHGISPQTIRLKERTQDNSFRRPSGIRSRGFCHRCVSLRRRGCPVGHSAPHSRPSRVGGYSNSLAGGDVSKSWL